MVLLWFFSDPRQKCQKIPHSDPDEIVSAQVLDGGLSEEVDLDLVSDNFLGAPRVELGQAHRRY